MTFYSTEKAALVLDVGERHIRVGIAGEAHPRVVEKAEFPIGRTGEVLTLRESGSGLPGSDAEWEEAVADWLRHVVEDVVGVDASERRLVVGEDLYTPSRFRNALAAAALSSLNMVSVLFAPSPGMALLPLSLPSALVLDIGGSGALTLPVVDSMPLHAKALFSRAGGRLVDANISRLLHLYAKPRDANARPALLVDLPDEDDDLGLDDPVWDSILAPTEHRKGTGSVLAHLGGEGEGEGEEEEEGKDALPAFPPSLVEDFKIKACFVRLGAGDALAPGAALPPDTEADVHLPVGLESVYDIKGGVRGMATEVLFQRGNGAEIVSLQELVLDTLLALPVDLRGLLASNILVIGGVANTPGLVRRLSWEIDALLGGKVSGTKYAPLAPLAGRLRFVSSPHKPDYVAWTGASIVGSMVEYLPQSSITRDEFLDYGKIYDWSAIGSKEEFAHLFHM